MGNRAVITTKDHDLALYLHWNGGRDTVEPLLRYCELQGYRSPSSDCYGWARMAQVVGNFFGGSLSVGIDRFSRLGDQGDNGIYVIDGWKIVDREGLYEGFTEQQEYPFGEMLHAFDDAMPEGERLGKFLDAEEVPVGDLKVGDLVWMHGFNGWESYRIAGFKDGRSYTARYENNGNWTGNPNNFVHGETAFIEPREK